MLTNRARARLRNLEDTWKPPTRVAEMLKRVERVIADLQPHVSVKLLPSVEDPHQQVHHAHLDEFVAADS